MSPGEQEMVNRITEDVCQNPPLMTSRKQN
jgi:hypothetical protein